MQREYQCFVLTVCFLRGHNSDNFSQLIVIGIVGSSFDVPRYQVLSRGKSKLFDIKSFIATNGILKVF